jgi:hypothetical protein
MPFPIDTAAQTLPATAGEKYTMPRVKLRVARSRLRVAFSSLEALIGGCNRL